MNTRIPSAKKALLFPRNCVRNDVPTTVISTKSATGKQIEKKVETKSPLKRGSTGFIRKAVTSELKPNPIMEASITSREDNFFFGDEILGNPMRANG